MTKGLGASAHLSRAGCINGTGILTQGSVVHTQARPWQDGVRELKGYTKTQCQEMSEMNSNSSTQRKIKQLLETVRQLQVPFHEKCLKKVKKEKVKCRTIPWYDPPIFRKRTICSCTNIYIYLYMCMYIGMTSIFACRKRARKIGKLLTVDMSRK